VAVQLYYCVQRDTLLFLLACARCVWVWPVMVYRLYGFTQGGGDYRKIIPLRHVHVSPAAAQKHPLECLHHMHRLKLAVRIPVVPRRIDPVECVQDAH
jgi:hypothetical protein